MDTGLLSLKWNNHSSTFFHVLENIRKKELYSDVTIACDGKFFSVHKLVLSTCSEYFQEMFERTQCKHPIIVLKDINYKDLESLLNYMYIGEVNVIQTELSSLIKAAECLKVKGLAVPDEPPSSRKSTKRPSVGDREESSSSHKRNRRSAPVNAVQQNQIQSPNDEKGSADTLAEAVEAESRENLETEKLRTEQQTPTEIFKEFDTITVKSEREDSPVPDTPFVSEDLAPITKFEFDGSPVDSTMSSNMDEGNESSYGGHLQPPPPHPPPSDENMAHLIPSTSRYGESSWQSEMDSLDKSEKERGGEGGNYDPNQPNPFLLDNSQGKSQMDQLVFAQHGREMGLVASAHELLLPTSESFMSKEGSLWACVYPRCAYKSLHKCKLLIHVRKHTGERPFACHLCGYKANQSNNLTRHYKNRHNIDKVC